MLVKNTNMGEKFLSFVEGIRDHGMRCSTCFKILSAILEAASGR
jgi:hypothetical protein